MSSFAERIGGVLVRPRSSLARTIAGEGGLADVSVLLALRVVAGETAQLARAALSIGTIGPAAALQGLLQAAGALLPDILGILIGGVALSLFRGLARARSSTAAVGKGHELDLAACAWIPYLAVKVVYALVYSALQRPATPVEEEVFNVVAVGWSVAVWALALIALREPSPSQGDAK